MKMAATRISFVIPTFNSARTLEPCLASIREQQADGMTIEIVVADAGSTDETVAIARHFGVDRIVDNPLQTGEAGKSAGIRVATGEFIALVDSDNVLDGPDWIARMAAPFADPRVVAAEPLFYTRRPEDPALTRYFAMLGMNDPLCLFLGNYDRFSAVTGRWTGLSVAATDRGDWLHLQLDPSALPTIGANGFVFRRTLLDHVSWTPYFFDIDVVHQAVQSGFADVAKVKCGIVHLYGRTLRDFARKQNRRVRDYLYFSSERSRSYPWNRQRKLDVLRFVLGTVLVVPLAAQALRGWRRVHDRAWWLHIPACWITLLLYGRAVLARLLGRKPRQHDRKAWRQ